jgi:hypothetical protein
MARGSLSLQRFLFHIRFVSYICSMLMLVTKTTFDFLIFFFSKGTVFSYVFTRITFFAYQGYPHSLVAVVMRMRRKPYFLLTFPVLL